MNPKVRAALKAVQSGQSNALQIGGLRITDSEIHELLTALPLHLKQLSLNGHKLTSSGLKEIAEFLKADDCELESLDLSSGENTMFDIESTRFFAEALVANKSLKNISLTANNINPPCSRILIDTVSKTNITTLDINLKANARRELDDILKVNKTKPTREHLRKQNFMQESAWIEISNEEIENSLIEINNEINLTRPINATYDSVDDRRLLPTILAKIHFSVSEKKIEKFKAAVLIEYFQAHPNLERFYSRLHARLKSLFLASQVAASEYFLTDKMNLQGKAGMAMQVMAPIFGAIPFVGSIFTTVLNAAGKATLTTDQLRQTSRLGNLGKHLKGQNSKSLVAQRIAIAMTLRYMEQLNELPLTAAEPNLAAFAGDEFLIRLASENFLAHRLAEVVFRHLVEIGVQQDKIDFLKPSLAEEFLNCYNQEFSFLEKAFNEIFDLGRLNKILTRSNRQWEFSKILNAPLMVTENNAIFSSENSNSNYGYQYVANNIIPPGAQSLPTSQVRPPVFELLENVERDVRNYLSRNSQSLLPRSEPKLIAQNDAPIVALPVSLTASSSAMFSRVSSSSSDLRVPSANLSSVTDVTELSSQAQRSSSSPLIDLSLAAQVEAQQCQIDQLKDQLREQEYAAAEKDKRIEELKLKQQEQEQRIAMLEDFMKQFMPGQGERYSNKM